MLGSEKWRGKTREVLLTYTEPTCALGWEHGLGAGKLNSDTLKCPVNPVLTTTASELRTPLGLELGL